VGAEGGHGWDQGAPAEVAGAGKPVARGLLP